MKTAQVRDITRAPAKNPFPLKPDQPGKYVLTCFWWKNLDCEKENVKENMGLSCKKNRRFKFGKKCEQYYQFWKNNCYSQDK